MEMGRRHLFTIRHSSSSRRSTAAVECSPASWTSSPRWLHRIMRTTGHRNGPAMLFQIQQSSEEVSAGFSGMGGFHHRGRCEAGTGAYSGGAGEPAGLRQGGCTERIATEGWNQRDEQGGYRQVSKAKCKINMIKQVVQHHVVSTDPYKVGGDDHRDLTRKKARTKRKRRRRLVRRTGRIRRGAGSSGGRALRAVRRSRTRTRLARWRRRRLSLPARRRRLARTLRRRGRRVSGYSRAYRSAFNRAYDQGFAAGYAQGLERGL